MWQSFRNYFWTAQLIAGGATGIKTATVAETPLEVVSYFLLGFVFALVATVPLSLAFAFYRSKFPERQRTLKQQIVRSVSFGLGICVVFFLIAVLFR